MLVNIDVEVLETLLKIPTGELTAALMLEDEPIEQSEAQKVVAAKIGESIKQRVATAKKEAREEGHGRGKSEALKVIEKQFAEDYGVDNTGNLAEMVKAFAESVTTVKAGRPEDIRNSEVYRNDIKAQIEKTKLATEELTQFKQSVETDKKKGAVSKALIEYVSDNFDLGANETIAKKRAELFVKEAIAAADDWDTSVFPPVPMKGGKPIYNDLQDPIGFEDFVKGIADEHFEQKSPATPKTPGVQGAPPAPQARVKPVEWANMEAYFGDYNAEPDLNKKMDMAKAWEAQQSKGQ